MSIDNCCLGAYSFHGQVFVRSSHVTVILYQIEEKFMGLDRMLESLYINIRLWIRLVLSFIFKTHYAFRRGLAFLPPNKFMIINMFIYVKSYVSHVFFIYNITNNTNISCLWPLDLWYYFSMTSCICVLHAGCNLLNSKS